MSDQITINPANIKYRESIITLLQSEKLPVEDLPANLSNFFTASDNGLVVGAIGLEIYEGNGLLRSLAVNPQYRKMKLAAGLVNEIEKLGKSLGLKGIYLLTETAQEYFAKKGYETINRSEAPASIRQSSEFSHVCPSSAILMLKKI